MFLNRNYLCSLKLYLNFNHPIQGILFSIFISHSEHASFATPDFLSNQEMEIKMKKNDFIKFKFEQDSISHIGLITFTDATSFDCQFLDLQDFHTFDLATLKVTSASGVYPTDSRLSVFTLYSVGETPQSMQVNDFIAITFADYSRFLGQVTDIDSFGNFTVLFLHSGQNYVFDTNNNIVNHDNPLETNTNIIGTEFYVAEDPTIVVTPTSDGIFTNGLWSLAHQVTAFAGRIGGAITPFAAVVHTTDESPDAWDGRVTEWTTSSGQGECAHFLIGRDQAHGVVQFASVFRNANHAGGAGHGSFVAGSQSWHPNDVSVGIELHNNGRLKMFDSGWRRYEYDSSSKKYIPHGTAIDVNDVILDSAKPGFGWHKVTDYQLEQLGKLL